jgi:hypothetical protein
MSLLTLSLFLIPIGLLTSYILTYLRSPLKEVPGPFLAKFSDLWRFFNHYSRSHIETQKALHEKYGDTVRLGPNVVSVTDPALVKKIYEIRGTYVKACNSTLAFFFLLGAPICFTLSRIIHLRKIQLIQCISMQYLLDKIVPSLTPHRANITPSMTHSKVVTLSPTSSVPAAMSFTPGLSSQFRSYTRTKAPSSLSRLWTITCAPGAQS